MKILVLSAGTRNKIIQYFRKALNGNGLVVATDASDMAPAIYEADKYYIVPRIEDPHYLDEVLSVCRKERIDAVLSLIDPELSLLAKNEDQFREIGTMIIGSSFPLCELAQDKMQMYEWLHTHGYPCARSWTDKEKFFEELAAGSVCFPVFIKPVRGSASTSISKVWDKEMVELLCTRTEGLMIQEFLDGQEIGVDVYVDMISGEVVSIFAKNKLAMRAGETDKAISIKVPALFESIEKFVLEVGFRGQIDIDLFEINGEYYILEVNPRFGGGYPHAYEAGCDHMKMIINNIMGVANTRNIGDYEEGVRMMKYNEVKILKG